MDILQPIQRRKRTRRGRGQRKKQRQGQVEHTAPAENLPPAQQSDSEVINLAGAQLTDAHIKVLSKGLTFSPTNVAKDFDLKIDLFRLG